MRFANSIPACLSHQPTTTVPSQSCLAPSPITATIFSSTATISYRKFDGLLDDFLWALAHAYLGLPHSSGVAHTITQGSMTPVQSAISSAASAGGHVPDARLAVIQPAESPHLGGGGGGNLHTKLSRCCGDAVRLRLGCTHRSSSWAQPNSPPQPPTLACAY